MACTISARRKPGFSSFPWTAFAFAGLAVGFILQSDWTRSGEVKVFSAIGLGGLVLIAVSRWLDRLALQVYPVYDYWHTSPEFFLIRVGMLMVIVTADYGWCRWVCRREDSVPSSNLGKLRYSCIGYISSLCTDGFRSCPSTPRELPAQPEVCW